MLASQLSNVPKYHNKHLLVTVFGVQSEDTMQPPQPPQQDKEDKKGEKDEEMGDNKEKTKKKEESKIMDGQEVVDPMNFIDELITKKAPIISPGSVHYIYVCYSSIKQHHSHHTTITAPYFNLTATQ